MRENRQRRDLYIHEAIRFRIRPRGRGITLSRPRGRCEPLYTRTFYCIASLYFITSTLSPFSPLGDLSWPILNLLRLSADSARCIIRSFIMLRFHYAACAPAAYTYKHACMRASPRVGRFLISNLLYSRRERSIERESPGRLAIIRSFSLCRRLYYAAIIAHTGVFNSRYFMRPVMYLRHLAISTFSRGARPHLKPLI